MVSGFNGERNFRIRYGTSVATLFRHQLFCAQFRGVSTALATAPIPASDATTTAIRTGAATSTAVRAAVATSTAIYASNVATANATAALRSAANELPIAATGRALAPTATS